MFVVTVTSPNGDHYSLAFEKSEVSIGRTSDNDVVLDDGNVSAHHGRIRFSDGKFIVVDTGSTNGIYVNELKVEGPVVVTGPNLIHLAVFQLSLSELRR